MIKAKIKNDEGEEVLFFGIDKENVRALEDGKQMYIKGEEIGLDIDILIDYGESVYDIMKRWGFDKMQSGEGETPPPAEVISSTEE